MLLACLLARSLSLAPSSVRKVVLGFPSSILSADLVQNYLLTSRATHESNNDPGTGSVVSSSAQCHPPLRAVSLRSPTTQLVTIEPYCTVPLGEKKPLAPTRVPGWSLPCRGRERYGGMDIPMDGWMTPIEVSLHAAGSTTSSASPRTSPCCTASKYLVRYLVLPLFRADRIEPDKQGKHTTCSKQSRGGRKFSSLPAEERAHLLARSMIRLASLFLYAAKLQSEVD